MAVGMFIKIGDIKGESTDAKHKDEIDVVAWHWGVNQSAAPHVGSGAGAGKVTVRELTISKRIDIASIINKRPTRPSPKPTISRIVSSAIIDPKMPASAPMTPASSQVGTVPDGGASGNRQR